MRMSVSILTANAFSMRSAMVLDKSERPLRNDDNVGRDTPSAVAAAPSADTAAGVRRTVSRVDAGTPVGSSFRNRRRTPLWAMPRTVTCQV